VVSGNPEVRVVSGAEAAEVMREFLGTGGQGAAGGSGSFGVPADSFSGSGSASGGGGGGSSGRPSASERMATLADLLNRGQITQQEYQARRQQILDEI
jgi:hypothetical protein